MLFVILIDAACCKYGAVNAAELMALIGQVQGANDVGPNRLCLIVLTPVNIRPACAASGIQDMSWLNSIEFVGNLNCIFHANSRGVDLFALPFQQGFQMAGHPALSSPNEKTVCHNAVVNGE